MQRQEHEGIGLSLYIVHVSGSVVLHNREIYVQASTDILVNHILFVYSPHLFGQFSKSCVDNSLNDMTDNVFIADISVG